MPVEDGQAPVRAGTTHPSSTCASAPHDLDRRGGSICRLRSRDGFDRLNFDWEADEVEVTSPFKCKSIDTLLLSNLHHLVCCLDGLYLALRHSCRVCHPIKILSLMNLRRPQPCPNAWRLALYDGWDSGGLIDVLDLWGLHGLQDLWVICTVSARLVVPRQSARSSG